MDKMIEILLARKYYGRHATGKVVVVNGQPHFHGPAREANEVYKRMMRIEDAKTQPAVKVITINVEWRKSRMYGANPFAEARVQFQGGNGTIRDGYTCSGSGYDKTSTVVADIFNEFLAYKLYGELEGERPYGIRLDATYGNRYEGGIGVECYRAISEYIGGRFETVASGKTFDVFRYTDGKEVSSEK
jgi:hypothetical protein